MPLTSASVDASAVLPDWARSEFVVQEQTTRWSSAVAAEFRQRYGGCTDGDSVAGAIEFVSIPGSRQIVARLGTTSVPGIIVVLNEAERETLLLLGRLARLSRPTPPVLILGNPRHHALVATMYEAGATSVLIDCPMDRQAAAWCHRVLKKAGRTSGRWDAQDV